jgi:hypothetical protein
LPTRFIHLQQQHHQQQQQQYNQSRNISKRDVNLQFQGWPSAAATAAAAA